MELGLLALFEQVPSYAVPRRHALQAKGISVGERRAAETLAAVAKKENLARATDEGLAAAAAVEAGESFAISGVAIPSASRVLFCYVVLTGQGVFENQPRRVRALRSESEPTKKAVAPFQEMAFLR